MLFRSVMDNYYETLCYKTVGGMENNIKVLNILRNSLGDNSSQYLENQIHCKPAGVTTTISRWSRFLMGSGGFDPQSLRTDYDSAKTAKNTALAELVAVYQGFAN